jgi:hypothetical protein
MFGQRIERIAEPPRRNEQKSEHVGMPEYSTVTWVMWRCSVGILQQIIQNRANISPKNPPSGQQQLTARS